MENQDRLCFYLPNDTKKNDLNIRELKVDQTEDHCKQTKIIKSRSKRCVGQCGIKIPFRQNLALRGNISLLGHFLILIDPLYKKLNKN